MGLGPEGWYEGAGEGFSPLLASALCVLGVKSCSLMLLLHPWG